MNAILFLVIAFAIQPAPEGRGFDRLDANGDGAITRQELPPRMRQNFDRLDRDGDGRISRAELALHREGRASPRDERLPDRPLPGAGEHLDLAYADNDNPRQRIDLVLPQGHDPSQARLPLVVFIHGGGWQAGDRKLALRKAVPFLQSGNYAVASVGYRLTDEAQWPAQIHDCKAAIRFLRGNADKYGLDPERIAVIGSSAGGHLVAMLGTSAGDESLEGTLGNHLGQPSHVTCVVDLFGPANMATMGDGESVINHNGPNSPESRLLGGPASDLPEVARHASPQTYVSGDEPPFLIIHGTADRVVPFAQSAAFHDALRQAGVETALITVTGGGHGNFANPEFDQITQAFVDKHLLGRETTIEDRQVDNRK